MYNLLSRVPKVLMAWCSKNVWMKTYSLCIYDEAMHYSVDSGWNNSNFKWGENCFHSKELQLTLNENIKISPSSLLWFRLWQSRDVFSLFLLACVYCGLGDVDHYDHWELVDIEIEMFQSCSQVWHESMKKRPSFQTPIRWTVGDLPGHNRLWQLQVALPLNLLFAWPYRQSVPLGSDWAPACPFKMGGE